MVTCLGLCRILYTVPLQRNRHVLVKYIPFSSREISVVQPDSPPSRPLLCVHCECWLPASAGRHFLEVINLPSGHWCSCNLCVFRAPLGVSLGRSDDWVALRDTSILTVRRVGYTLFVMPHQISYKYFATSTVHFYYL